MANIKIDIEQIETNSIFVQSKLIVTIKNRIAFEIIGLVVVFTISLIFFLKMHQYFSFTTIFIFLIIFISDKYVFFFPIKVPYLVINSLGIGYKKKIFSWHEIETIQYQIINPNVRLSGYYINIGLKSMKTISIDLNKNAIDSSIEVIAAYIKEYWSKN